MTVFSGESVSFRYSRSQSLCVLVLEALRDCLVR